mgnify:CR=1 FL=1
MFCGCGAEKVAIAVVPADWFGRPLVAPTECLSLRDEVKTTKGGSERVLRRHYENLYPHKTKSQRLPFGFYLYK